MILAVRFGMNWNALLPALITGLVAFVVISSFTNTAITLSITPYIIVPFGSSSSGDMYLTGANDQISINTAIDYATKERKPIIIKAGDVNTTGPIELKSNLTITASGVVTVRASMSSRPATEGIARDYYGTFNCYERNISNVVVDGFNIVPNPASVYKVFGVKIRPPNTGYSDNITLKNLTQTGGSYFIKLGVLAWDELTATHGTIGHITIDNCSTTGLGTGASSSFTEYSDGVISSSGVHIVNATFKGGTIKDYGAKGADVGHPEWGGVWATAFRYRIDNLVVDGVKVENTYGGLGQPGAQNLWLKNSLLTAGPFTGSSGIDVSVQMEDYARDGNKINVIEYNEIIGNWKFPIFVGADHIVCQLGTTHIQYNNIHDVTADLTDGAILFAGLDAGNRSKNVWVEHNTITNTAGSGAGDGGIELYFADTGFVRYNVLTNVGPTPYSLGTSINITLVS